MKRCGCGAKAAARWNLRLCADGGRKRVLHLCDACDYRLNQHILVQLGDVRAGAKMARYKAQG